MARSRSLLRVEVMLQLAKTRPWTLITRLNTQREHSRGSGTRRPRSQPHLRSLQHRLTTAEVDLLVAGYLDGRTVYELAATHGVNRNTVAEHLKRREVELRRRTCTAEQTERARLQYRAGRSLASVAADFDVDPSTIYRALVRINEPLRTPQGR